MTIKHDLNKTRFKIGSRFECFADGNPPPSFSWIDVVSEHVISNEAKLSLNQENMRRGAMLLLCSAYNFLSSANATVNFSIAFDENKTKQERQPTGRHNTSWYSLDSPSVLLFIIFFGKICAKFRKFLCNFTHIITNVHIQNSQYSVIQRFYNN